MEPLIQEVMQELGDEATERTEELLRRYTGGEE